MPKTLLRGLSAAAIVGAVGDAAARWSDADFPPRVRATQAIEARLGYSTPVVEYALDRLFFALRAEALQAAITDELGSLAALDGPVERAGRPAGFARGVDRVAIVSSDTTIGVAVMPAVYALCAKCRVVVKDRNDALVRAFFDSLVDERPEFRAAAVARAWAGGSDADEAALLGTADVVVAFGGDAALRAIRAQLSPTARFVPFGHRASIGYVDAAAVASASARARSALLEAIATDALLYDGDGCLSLHALFVAGERGAAEPIVADLAAAFERVTIEFPAGSPDPQRAASAAAYRNLGTFRAAGGRGAIYAPAQQSATIAFDPPRDVPPPFLARVLPVYPVAGPADAIAYLAGHRLPVAALGVDNPRAPEALAFAEAIGAVRIARLGEMQAPPVGGHHGGAPRIADFVRWIDRE
jgi:hypothetical protein